MTRCPLASMSIRPGRLYTRPWQHPSGEGPVPTAGDISRPRGCFRREINHGSSTYWTVDNNECPGFPRTAKRHQETRRSRHAAPRILWRRERSPHMLASALRPATGNGSEPASCHAEWHAPWLVAGPKPSGLRCAVTAQLWRLKRPSEPYLGTLDDQRSKNAPKPVFFQGKIGGRFG